jgi:hypothetical protein
MLAILRGTNLHSTFGLLFSDRSDSRMTHSYNSKMTTKVRRQLTLFLQKDSSQIVERVRRKFNPVQFALIKAHVTLCREDEIEDIDGVLANLASLNERELTLPFGKPVRFDEGKGVYLQADEAESYHQLRHQILKTVLYVPGKQTPHITLMHPRNSTCTDALFEQLCKEDFPSSFSFNEISLIEQQGEEKWEVLENFSLEK